MIRFSLIFGNTTPMGEKLSLHHHYACVCAEVGGVYGFSTRVWVGEIPAHLLADGASADVVMSDPFFLPLVEEARVELIKKAEKIAEAIREPEVA